MNNPFSRLKHFIPDLIDAQENHATECLAACLVFSPKMRSEFIRFMLAEQFLYPVRDILKVEIVTQQVIEGGYVDLVLAEAETFTLAVEVKVKSRENCDHHHDQLKKYRMWLDTQPSPHRYLFTLIRNPDKNFDANKHGADGRQTWQALCKRFQNMLSDRDLAESEASLIDNFCKYLESEGIVSAYQTADLLAYGAGLKACKAVRGIFNQLDSRLRDFGFISVLREGKDDQWPQLKIEHPKWQKVFGKGQNQKISLWYTVPGVWEASRHDFSFEIELWLEGQEHDWEQTRAKLPKWMAVLKSQGFVWDVYHTWNRSNHNVPAQEIKIAPKRINSYKREEEIILNQLDPQNEDVLIDLLVTKTRQYFDILCSLNP